MMNDAEYFDTAAAGFAAAHPIDQGWRTYFCDPDLREKLFLEYLLDFIRDRQDVVVKRASLGEARAEDMLAKPGKSSAAASGDPGDGAAEIGTQDWIGSLEIDWRGQPIHYRSLTYSENLENASAVFVATKSNAVMREFHSLLAAWGLERSRQGQRHITVINGEDIPIQPAAWSALILPPGMAEEIRSNVEAFFKSRDRYRELGIPYRRGFLFAGPPGCGKTLTLRTICANVATDVVALNVRGDMAEWQIDKAFAEVGLRQPAVLVIEDLDRLIDGPKVSMAQLLNLLDGFKPLDGVLVLATCNHPERLDEALLHRPSRFDRVWRFPMPDLAERLELLRLRGSKYFSEDALRQAAAKSDGFSMAYVQEIVVNALLEAAHADRLPTDAHLKASLATLTSQRKKASKGDEDLATRDNIGFVAKERPGEWEYAPAVSFEVPERRR